MKLILASQSPRRKEILTHARIVFQTMACPISEEFAKNLSLNEQIMELAERKARACLDKLQNAVENYVVLSADTVVIYQGRVLGKPESEAEAESFLRLLSGNTHQVKTGICFLQKDLNGQEKSITEIETTDVTFKKLSQREIFDYIQSGEPFDKAGAYGIQGLAGKFVEKVEGSYHNVVGLPIEKVLEIIQKQGWNFIARS